jgi:CDP-diacylglycerol--glycerol-3-phosphate 3-phosphatidyltransferase
MRWRSPADVLTLLRIVLVPVIVGLVLADGSTARWWAFGLFVTAAVSDSVDGWLARTVVGTSAWGALADPAADKALVLATFAALAWQGELPWWALALIVVREVAVTWQRTVLARRGFVMPASMWGKAKTVTQLVLVAVALVPSPPAALVTALLMAAVAMTLVSGLEYAGRGRRLVRAG